MSTNFYRGVLSVGATKVAALAVTFLATLVTIRTITGEFGAESYGAVSLVATLVTLVPFADLGLGLMLVNLTVWSSANRSSGRLRLSVSIVFWTLVLTATLIFGATAMLAALGQWENILGKPSLLLGDPNAYMPWYGLLAFFWVLGGPGLRLLVGAHRANTLILLQTLAPVIAAAATVIAATRGVPLLAYAFFPLIATVVCSGAAWAISLRVVGGSLRHLVPVGRIKRQKFIAVVRVGLGGIWFAMGGLLLFAVDRILLSHIGAPSDLAQYVLAVPLFTAVQSTLGSIGTFLWPRYAQLRAAHELPARRFLREVAAFASLGVAAGVAVVLALPAYMALLGAEASSPLIGVSMGSMALLQAITLPFTSVLTSDGLLRLQGLALFGALGVKLALAPLLVPGLGAAGLFLATAAGVAVVQMPVLVTLARRLFTQPSPS